MTRIIARKNIRVELYPLIRASGQWNPWYQERHVPTQKVEKDFTSAANELHRQLLKHLDGEFDSRISYDNVVTCSFCAYEFDVSEKFTDMPECCDEAQEEFTTMLEEILDVD
jgi:hypothetical protein